MSKLLLFGLDSLLLTRKHDTSQCCSGNDPVWGGGGGCPPMPVPSAADDRYIQQSPVDHGTQFDEDQRAAAGLLSM